MYGGGEPRPAFVETFRDAVERGDLEVLVARVDGRPVGVLVLAFRLSVSLGGSFVSVEDLYVEPEARGRGAGRALLEAAEARCQRQGISYVEVQTDDESAGFYRSAGFGIDGDVRILSKSFAIGAPGG